MHFKNISKQLVKIIVVIAIVLTAYSSSPIVIFSEKNNTNDAQNHMDKLEQYITNIIEWRKSRIDYEGTNLLNNKFLEQAGDTTVDWYVFGLGRTGMLDDYEAYLAVIEDTVIKRYETAEKLSLSKATEWHRIALAMLAAGGDPTTLGEARLDSPINLIADGTYNRGLDTRPLGAQGINGWIWGLITLDSMRYKVPEEAVVSREQIIIEILQQQLADGGFSLQQESEFNVDLTAMAIQALAPYYNDEKQYTYKQIAIDKEVTKTVHEVIDEALDLLEDAQLSDGDYALMEMPNLESTAQVTVALTSLGIDILQDERFKKNGNTLMDGILKYRMEDGGFVHSYVYDEENPSAVPDESNMMASEQALYTFVALYRFYGEYRSLYDLREEWDQETKLQIDQAIQAIDALPATISNAEHKKVEKALQLYKEVPVEERSYVSNYRKLANALYTLQIDSHMESLVDHSGSNQNGKGARTYLFSNEVVDDHQPFTEEDEANLKKLVKDKTSTEHYVQVVKWIEQLKNTENKREHKKLLVLLEEEKQLIEQLESDIHEMNQIILDELNPFDQLTTDDKETVELLMAQYEELSTYDQDKIIAYEDIDKAKAQINSLQRESMIKMVVILLIVILSATVIYQICKKKRKTTSDYDED